jgi:hypothetical protein
VRNGAKLLVEVAPLAAIAEAEPVSLQGAKIRQRIAGIVGFAAGICVACVLLVTATELAALI